jgi:Xaa-Pro aminopeptidase
MRRYQLGLDDMHAIFEPGASEVALWARLQEANFLRFGEWMETRQLASGPRTNPWYQEASRKGVEAGELMAFDTDLIGAYGMRVDLSRTWLCGGGRPSRAQADVGRRSGGEDVKLEQQILVTDSGPELLTHYPVDRV